MNNQGYAIGIDLATCYCCVGVYRNQRVEIIPSAEGDRTVPSYVAWTADNVRLIGAPAKQQAPMNPTRTIYDVKRLIGRKFSDPEVQEDIAKFSYPVRATEDDRPVIVMDTQMFAPEEISAMILSKLKESAEAYLGEAVTQAVITVPAYFNDMQRQATRDAGRIAGLEVLRIVNEPTASAFAYGLNQGTDIAKTILVYDFGGGTLDVTILTLDQGLYEVLATSGDTHLGGEDLDDRLCEYLAQEFQRKNHVSIEGNLKAKRRLRNACERAKRVLSTATQANIEIDSLADGLDFATSLTRARFEELCTDLFKKTLVSVAQALSDSNLKPAQIDEVILVGGSSRIPKVQKLLEEFFSGKKLCNTVHPDEAVASGAAIHAALLADNPRQSDSQIDCMVLLDVCPLSIGVETAGGAFVPIIKRNSSLPTRSSQMFSTFADNQTTVLVQVFEGERQFTRDCHALGKFQLCGIPPAAKGSAQIQVTFELNTDSILTVTAKECATGNSSDIKITHNKGALTEMEIKRMIDDAGRFAEQDKADMERIRVRTEFESYLWSIRGVLREAAAQKVLSAEERSNLQALVAASEQWIEANALAASSFEISEQSSKVKSVCQPLMDKILSSGNNNLQSTPVKNSGSLFGPGISSSAKPIIEEK